MVNYQLYHTNIALGGQLKWDIVLSNTPDGLIVTNFGLSPVSRNITYNPKPVNDLLNYSHTDNLITYYKEMSSKFWENGEDPILKSDWPVVANEPIDTHYSCIEMGCRRGRYSTYERQFEFFIPCWLEKLGKSATGEQSVLQFTIYLCAKNTVLASKTLELEYKPGCETHNRFVKYFLDYADKIGINGEGNDQLMQINLSKHKAFISGTDIQSGDFVKRDVSLSLIPNILRRERPLMDVDGMIIDCFANNHLIAPQLFNFCLHFNPTELLSSTLMEMVYSKGFNIRVRANIQRAKANASVDSSIGEIEKLELRDIYSNYDYIPRKLFSLINIKDYCSANSTDEDEIDDPIDKLNLRLPIEVLENNTFTPLISAIGGNDIYEQLTKGNTAQDTTWGDILDGRQEDLVNEDIYSRPTEVLDSSNIELKYLFGKDLAKRVTVRESNVLSYMQDFQYVDTVAKNRICPRICHWSMKDNPEYIFNLYNGFGAIIDTGELATDEEDPTPDYVIRSHFYQDSPDVWGKTHSAAGNNIFWATAGFITSTEWENRLFVNFNKTAFDRIYGIASKPTAWNNNLQHTYDFGKLDNDYKFLILTPPTPYIYTKIESSKIDKDVIHPTPYKNYPAYRLNGSGSGMGAVQSWVPIWGSGVVYGSPYGGAWITAFRSMDETYPKALLKSAIKKAVELLSKVDTEELKDLYGDFTRLCQSLWINVTEVELRENLNEENFDKTYLQTIEEKLYNTVDELAMDRQLLIGLPQSQYGLTVITARHDDAISNGADRKVTPELTGEAAIDMCRQTMNHLSFANVRNTVSNLYYIYNAIFSILNGHYVDGELIPSNFIQAAIKYYDGNPEDVDVSRIWLKEFEKNTYPKETYTAYRYYSSDRYLMNVISVLYHYVNDIKEPQIIPFSKSVVVTRADAPSVKATEVEYYKDDDVSLQEIFVVRQDGYIKPTFISPNDSYRNFMYFKEQWASKENEWNLPLLSDSPYAKYTPTKHIPHFPSVGYYPIYREDIIYSPDANVLDVIPKLARLNKFEYNWFQVGYHYLLRPKLSFYLYQSVPEGTTPETIKSLTVNYVKNLYDISDELAAYIVSCYNVTSSYDYINKTRTETMEDGSIKKIRYTDLHDYVYRLNLILK